MAIGKRKNIEHEFIVKLNLATKNSDKSIKKFKF
jgi:hypothetical protein